MYLRHETPVHYIVDMRTLPGQDWKPFARRVKDTSYVVKNLRPDKEYQFRIKAETDAGVSEPTYPVTIYRKPGNSNLMVAKDYSSFMVDLA